MYVYFCSLHVSGNHVPIIRRTDCIDAIPGVCHSVWTTSLLMIGIWLPETCTEQK